MAEGKKKLITARQFNSALSEAKAYIDNSTSNGGMIVDETLSEESEHLVQNKAIAKAVNAKANKTAATSTADGLMSAEDKEKLDNLTSSAIDILEEDPDAPATGYMWITTS